MTSNFHILTTSWRRANPQSDRKIHILP